MNLKVKTRLSI